MKQSVCKQMQIKLTSVIFVLLRRFCGVHVIWSTNVFVESHKW